MLTINNYMGGVTRRKFILSTAAFGATCLLPSIAIEGELEPEQNVFVIGDLHLTNNDGVRKKAAEIVSALKTLAGGKTGFHLIFNGDFLEFPNLAKTAKNASWQWEQFAKLLLPLKEAGFIPHLVFGNHDGEVSFGKDALRGIIPSELIGDSSFEVAENRFILVGGIHPSELNYGFLDSELSAAQGKRTIVATHYPPDKLTYLNDKFGKKVGYNLWAKPEIIERIAKTNASIISSHAHSPFAGSYDSCRLGRKINVLVTPSVTYTLPYLRTEFRPARVLGITILNLKDSVGKAKFYDGKKAFRPSGIRVDARKGSFVPLPVRLRRV